MLKVSSCPKCRGDVLVDKDEYGRYEECLQCGYLRDLESIVEAALKIDSCPKCQGDVLLDKDEHGRYEQCLQCGYLRALESIV